MAIEKFTVSRDDSIYQAWPVLVQTDAGDLLCIFTECKHHGNREGSRLMLCKSYDRGRTWTEKAAFTESTAAQAYFNCARISKLIDGTLAVLCDRLTSNENKCSEIYFWKEDVRGNTWSAPKVLPLCGIVPDKLLQLQSGRLLISAHLENRDTGRLEQYLWYSDDNGGNWSERVTVASDNRYDLCEGSILECRDGTLVVFIRKNSGQRLDCFKAFSRDGVESWQGLCRVPIPACHRPFAGFLLDGTVMITHRFMQVGKGWFGHWTQNVFAAFLTEESVKAPFRAEQSVRIMPLDYDRSSAADLGYTGWTQFADGEIYVVNYIVDDAPKAQIRGYAFHLSDVLIDPQAR